MVLQFSHVFSVLSTDTVQIFWPQMTYFRLSAERFFMTHSAISLPERVGVYIRYLQDSKNVMERDLHHQHQSTSYPSPAHSNDPNFQDTHNPSYSTPASRVPATQQ